MQHIHTLTDMLDLIREEFAVYQHCGSWDKARALADLIDLRTCEVEETANGFDAKLDNAVNITVTESEISQCWKAVYGDRIGSRIEKIQNAISEPLGCSFYVIKHTKGPLL